MTVSNFKTGKSFFYFFGSSLPTTSLGSKRPHGSSFKKKNVTSYEEWKFLEESNRLEIVKRKPINLIVLSFLLVMFNIAIVK